MGGTSFLGSMEKDIFIFYLFKVPNHSQPKAPIKDSRNILFVPLLSMWWHGRCAWEASQFSGPASCPFRLS